MSNEDLIKHLEFIQNVINRMANNSFLLKGWTVTIVAALFALAAQNANLKFVILALFPVIAFWILDSYYLRQERLFRGLYNKIRARKDEPAETDVQFSLDTKGIINVDGWARTMISKTILIFYGMNIITIIIVIIIAKNF
jgi:hypothetical protein